MKLIYKMLLFFVQLYAIKRINFTDVVMDELPKTEAGIMMNLSHPNIIYIKEFFEENDEFYIVMEYADNSKFIFFYYFTFLHL